ncbi:IS66 family insertion sequence element accessory protein TnpB [Sinorhizobium meliloti]|uniref:IS66 family insertion sequence element accessory protein TnpB n=1 Tax=Rhizobium meliloti TaxID=382 RepID=UPI002286388B|nr:IS66 family insertion sequence element accessory protein TnpB [Sinorhizobium meliloti]
MEGLAVLAQDVLRQKPTGGAVFAFRGRRGDRLKLLYFDGQGFCLYYKILQRGRFPWPSAADGAARLTSAQLAMLWEGIDWRRPNWGAPPRVSVDFISLNLLVFMDTRPDLWQSGSCRTRAKVFPTIRPS